jgi:hypothetical protein
MRMLTSAVVLTIVSTAAPALAASGGLMDTRTLGLVCKEDTARSMMYVMGVVEQAYLTKTAKFCIRKGYTMLQARDLVCKYIATEAPQEALGLSAAAVTNEVLGRDWPCP